MANTQQFPPPLLGRNSLPTQGLRVQSESEWSNLAANHFKLAFLLAPLSSRMWMCPHLSTCWEAFPPPSSPSPSPPLMPGTLVRRVDKKCASFLYGHNGGVNMAEMFKLFINQTGFFIALSRFPCPLYSHPFPAICRAFYIEVNKPKSKFCLCCASQECINIILKSQWNMANDFDEWPHLPPPVPPAHTHPHTHE